MEDRIREWFQDILEKIRKVQAFTAGMTFPVDQSDRKT